MLLCGHVAISAHAFSVSTAQVSANRHDVVVVFTMSGLDLQIGSHIDGNGDGDISVDELDGAIEPIVAAIRANYRVTSGAEPIAMVVNRYHLARENLLQLNLTYTFAAPVERVTLTSTLHRITDANHSHLADVTLGETVVRTVLNAASSSATVKRFGGGSVGHAARFVTLGIAHIFTGYDHLAFLVGLLVGANSIRALVKVVTSFTAAHTVTLGLATFGWVSLSSTLVEALIALTVIYVAIENLVHPHVESRWRLTFLFGLVHGLGLSTVLRETYLPGEQLAFSLFTFNAGVEIGQLLFVVLLFPVCALLARRPSRRRLLIEASSAVILCMGVSWFVQRAVLG